MTAPLPVLFPAEISQLALNVEAFRAAGKIERMAKGLLPAPKPRPPKPPKKT